MFVFPNRPMATLFVLLGVLFLGGSATPHVGAEEVSFAEDIRPLLSNRCFECHGPDEAHRQADLRLDDYASITSERGGYQVVRPGDAESSELYRRISSDEDYLVMPPPDSGKAMLNEQEQDRIRRWIEQGAVWQQHWAYEPPRDSPIPDAVPGIGECENWIDRFVARKLSRVGGVLSPRAGVATLARRLSFDLTGLPPSPADVRALEEAPGAAALQQYVERLLASPAFGERLAMYWLDLVRFADTVGYHGDQDHNISPYRDYVIDAFNDNLPFDQFTIEQLAGDLLPNPTQEQIIATGYNRLLQTSHEGGVQPEEYLTIYQADRIRNLSAVWMGATVGCAQCHDHKYDPFTAQDFYALAAFFADIDEADHFKVGSNSLPTKRPPEIPVLSRRERQLLARYEFELDNLRSVQQAEGSSGGQHRAESKAVGKVAQLQSKLVELKESARLTMITRAIEPREVRFLPRGNWLDDSGDVMQPAVPEFLSAGFAELTVGSERPNRLHLARWLTDTQHGIGLLTARVFVNRLWMLLFGEGLSRSVEDFGGQGEPPTHPELLDQLALEFVRSGWDIKHMLRLMTSSAVYRQSSMEQEWHREHDPLNRLLARQNRFRLPAEMVRDVSLDAAGLLVRRIGGGSVKPYQPSGYYRHLNFPKREYEPTTDEGQWRRGVYMHWQRQFLHPMLRALDAPMREECTASRAQSNTPLAALVWLNDPSFVEAARGLALRVLCACNGESPALPDDEFLRRMFRRAVSREADAMELNRLRELLRDSRQAFDADPQAAKELLAVGVFRRDTSVPEKEQAAWTIVARAVLNLNETYTRN